MYAVACNADYVLSASGDRTLRLWNPLTGKRIRTFKGYQCRVCAVTLLPIKIRQSVAVATVLLISGT
ncbi:MAG: hypothetical protein SAJ12_04635 [Jaaginema sp. PMC 1079.18]|nr:hypothetical protein [Jaaginema sp. PMC 1080.18]MEC4850278.1 hypothetical protein [Jaaginema sp. PMC 1079.18]MEC4866896.1 hypothetical protein [Jaaginema sp. PMC 1078.18]